MTMMANHLKTTIGLGVNVDHVATLRQARGTLYPDPVQAALEAELAGADAITVHLREDRRHIQERDVLLIKQLKQTRLNFEMAVTDFMVEFASQLNPEHCLFVPEKREELTTEGGLDVISHNSMISNACSTLSRQGIEVSLFIDPDPSQINAAAQCGAPCIEIHTGAYAEAENDAIRLSELEKLKAAAEYAAGLGLKVNAGHGLHYHNVQPVAAISCIAELNIGHSIISRALFSGMQEAVKTMKTLMTQARLT